MRKEGRERPGTNVLDGGEGDRSRLWGDLCSRTVDGWPELGHIVALGEVVESRDGPARHLDRVGSSGTFLFSLIGSAPTLKLKLDRSKGGTSIQARTDVMRGRVREEKLIVAKDMPSGVVVPLPAPWS